MDHIQQEALKRASTMEMFVCDGKIKYGAWRDWYKAKPEDKQALLDEFNKNVVNAQKELVSR